MRRSALRPMSREKTLIRCGLLSISLPLLAATYRRFPLTGLLYGLIFLHALAYFKPLMSLTVASNKGSPGLAKASQMVM